MDIASIITAATGFVTAVTALWYAIRGQKQHAALAARVARVEGKLPSDAVSKS